MSKISVVMPVYNGAKFITESIDSVLNQSFADFELIIIDDGSSDRTRDIVLGYGDERIVLLENQHDFIQSLNLGLKRAQGKYIARMDADDRMHRDRLKIQYAIMEEEPRITVCGSWMIPFGDTVFSDRASGPLAGYVEYPLVELLKANVIFHPTVMIRKSFLDDHMLFYKPYTAAEDYKLWCDIAERNGVFYIESQALLFYRVSDNQVSRVKNKEQLESGSRIKEEILEVLIGRAETGSEMLKAIRDEFFKLESLGMMDKNEIYAFFYSLLSRNLKKLGL